MCRTSIDESSWGQGGPMLAATAFAHIGFMTKLAWYLRLGTTTYLLDRWRASDVLRLVSQHRMSSIGGVAPQLALLLREPDVRRRSTSRASGRSSWAAPSRRPRSSRKRGDGSARRTRSATRQPSPAVSGRAPRSTPTTTRRCSPSADRAATSRSRIVDENDLRLSDGEIGEVCLRSSSMMRGYWNDERATAEALRDGWLHTGDLGWIDERGLSPPRWSCQGDVRARWLQRLPAGGRSGARRASRVVEVAVVPRPDPVMGEIGVAVVVAVDRLDAGASMSSRAFADAAWPRTSSPRPCGSSTPCP